MIPPIEAFSGEEHNAFSLVGGKPAALFVHGFPGTANDLRPQAQVLNAEGWTTYNVLLPGFGAAIETLPNYGFDDWFKTVTNRLHELQRHHSPVLLVGHSMGGALSINVAAKTLVDGLLLLAPFYKINHFLWSILPLLHPFLPQVKPFKLFKPDFKNPEFRDGIKKFMPTFDFDNPQHQLAIRDFAIPVRVFAQIRMAGMNAYANAPKITAPTMVIQGTRDTLVVPENTRKLASRLGGASSWLEVDGEHEINRADFPSWDAVRTATLDFARMILTGKA